MNEEDKNIMDDRELKQLASCALYEQIRADLKKLNKNLFPRVEGNGLLFLCRIKNSLDALEKLSIERYNKEQ